jgi:pimeloyl-ACP methyl ester carboxylesterase
MPASRGFLLLVGVLVLAANAFACEEETPPPSTATATLAPSTPTETPDQQSELPVFDAAECQFEVPPGRTVECGYLTVPENRSQPDGPTIRLHVAIFRTQNDYPAPDPIVYLAGGPGENSLKAVPLVFDLRFAPLLTNRDFIMFDQRGVGCSEPALDCPELTQLAYDTIDQHLSVEESAALRTEAVSKCHDRLVSEGVNLAAYTSAESAADVNDLRRALGYEEWNLFGASYGTKLALTTMRDFPDGIRSVVLDSSYPLQVDLYAETPANATRASAVLFDGCAADVACDSAYPELETVFFEVVEELNETPITVSITNPLTAETFENAVVSGDEVIRLLFQSLYSTEIIPFLPRIIYDAHSNSFDLMALILGSFLANVDFVSMGMQFSVQCGEEVAFSSEEEIAAGVEAYPDIKDFFDTGATSGRAMLTICEIWGAKEAAPIENEPVSSDIPTLVLSGEYDPITPPAWGELVAENLDNSFYFEFPGLGHHVSISHECPLRMTLAFIDGPKTRPDASCLAAMTGPGFVVPSGR